MELSMSNKKRATLSLWLATATIAVAVLAAPAFAVLGGSASSVSADAAHMKAAAQVRVAPNGAYSVHEMQSPQKVTVREFVSPDGRVFGIAWQGPLIPSMQQLLGTYFQQYSAAAKEAKSKHAGRRPLNIRKAGLVVQNGGIMRSYFGRAYVPDMLPQGVTAEEIR
jgi:hypothetical protein